MVNQWRRVKRKMDFYHKEKQEWCTRNIKILVLSLCSLCFFLRLLSVVNTKTGKSSFYPREIQEWCVEEHRDFIAFFVFSVFLPSAVLRG
jgi:hypothetical protein